METENLTLRFDVILNTTVVIVPQQLNSNLYENIKSNLSARLLNKCYGHYGFISKIYSLEEISENNEVRLEDNNCNVYYDVKFKCQIIKPTLNKTVIAQVILNKPSYLTLSNGPMRLVITNDRYSDVFTQDQDTKLYYYNNSNNKIISPGDFLTVEIIKFQIDNKSPYIYIAGRLVDVVNDNSLIEKYFVETYKDIN